jgi:hypothetical protein
LAERQALEDAMLARAILVMVVAAVLAGCVDSERLREGLGGPKDRDTTERTSGK